MEPIPLYTTVTVKGTHGRPDRRLTLWDVLVMDGIVYIAALPEGKESGPPILLQQVRDEDGSLRYQRIFRKQEEVLASLRRRDKSFIQILRVDKYEVRDRLHHCISTAYDIADWDNGYAGNCQLTDRVECVRQLHRAVDWAFEQYGDAVKPGCAQGRRYLVNINDDSFHPAFLLTTLFVLLLAGADIHLRYPSDWDSYFSPGRILNRVETLSPNVFWTIDAVRTEQKYIQWVNEADFIDRIVDLGDAANMYHRYLQYKRPFHAPATRFVWVDYTDNDNLCSDEQLQRYGDLCYDCSYDYETFYNAEMKDLHTIHTYAGMDYEICTEAELFRELQRNADNPLFRDKVQLVVFTDKDEQAFCLPENLQSRVQLMRQQQLSHDDLMYDFMQLLAD